MKFVLLPPPNFGISKPDFFGGSLLGVVENTNALAEVVGGDTPNFLAVESTLAEFEGAAEARLVNGFAGFGVADDGLNSEKGLEALGVPAVSAAEPNVDVVAGIIPFSTEVAFAGPESALAEPKENVGCLA